MSATTKTSNKTKTCTASRTDASTIDYGPALHAVEDLLTSAFELAQKNVAGWPQGKRRVRNAHRYVCTVLRGKRPRTEPTEDLLFTSALLTRVLDADLGLGLEHVVDVLERLGLPLDHVPFAAPTPAVQAKRPPIAPSSWRHLRAIYGQLSPGERVLVRLEAEDLTAAERDGWIAALSALTVEEGVGVVRAYLRDQIAAPPPAVAPLPMVPRVLVRSPTSAAHPLISQEPTACSGCGCPSSISRRAA